LHLYLIKQTQHHKDVLGSGGIVLCILNHGTGWRWAASFMSNCCTTEKRTTVPIG